MTRRLSFMLVLVAVLAGCTSGSDNVASSTQSTSPKSTSSTSPTATSSATPKATAKATGSTSPKTTKVSVGSATSFCAAFKEMQGVKASAGAAAAGAAYQTVAAEMRKYAPAAIKVEAVSYAKVIDDAGKALKSGTMPTLSAKSTDLAKVTVWVGKNCPLK